jgi:hypothetical protein
VAGRAEQSYQFWESHRMKQSRFEGNTIKKLEEDGKNNTLHTVAGRTQLVFVAR